MKRMRLNLVGCACALTLLGNPAMSSAKDGATDKADTHPVTVPILKVQGRRLVPSGKAIVLVNDLAVDFGGASLLDSGGNLMVPARPLAEALGAQITIAGRTMTITVTHAGSHSVLTLTSSNPAQMLYPLRSLCELFDAKLSIMPDAHGGPTRISISSTPPSPDVDVPDADAPDADAPDADEPDNDTGEKAAPKNDSMAAHIRHNLERLNAYRKQAGVAPLQLDEKLNAFALAGSQQLMRDHRPHQHFKDSEIWNSGFQNAAAENQGDPNGWIPGPINGAIDDILKSMMSEGPGGGHHDNILNPAYHRLGVGLVQDKQGKLYLTNDFSG